MRYFNPYTGQDFFGFFLQLFYRIGELFTGNIGWNDLASDEIQILVLLGVAASSALVGSFLVLRKMTMLANSLSHTILLGIVLAYVLSPGDGIDMTALLFAAFIMGIVTTYLTEFLTKKIGLQEDASVGLVFTTLFAFGVISATVLTRNAHVGIEAVMGNADSLRLEDCTFVYLILGINVLLITLFFKEFKITTFDSNFSRALGISPVIFNYLLMTQVSFTTIGGFRAVGVLMILAFITGPPLTARFLTDDLKKMLFLSVGIGALASITGVALSRHLLSVNGIALSTGGIVVCMIVVFFLAGLAFHFYSRRQVQVNSHFQTGID